MRKIKSLAKRLFNKKERAQVYIEVSKMMPDVIWNDKIEKLINGAC